ncbi:hypothetical protein BSKO_05525 [Bryopsis sp. KO-2023]|nr:hypothetical protein BSKO_05525 [Bryopsis sp. KO-2023]
MAIKANTVARVALIALHLCLLTLGAQGQRDRMRRVVRGTTMSGAVMPGTGTMMSGRAAMAQSDSVASGGGTQASSAARSTGGRSTASAAARVAKQEFARDAVARSIAEAVDSIQNGAPVQAAADASALAIGEAVAVVQVETEATAVVEGDGSADANAEASDSAVATVFVDALAEAFANVGNGLQQADAQALASATATAVSTAIAQSKSEAAANDNSSAEARNTVIARAVAKPLAQALAKAFAQILNIPLATSDSSSNVELNDQNTVDSQSDSRVTGDATAVASGIGEAESFFVDAAGNRIDPPVTENTSNTGVNGVDLQQPIEGSPGDVIAPIYLQNPFIPLHLLPEGLSISDLPIVQSGEQGATGVNLNSIPREYLQYPNGVLSDWVEELLRAQGLITG